MTAAEVPTDPTVVVLHLKEPSEVETTYTYGEGFVARSGVGEYYALVTLDKSGTWSWRWAGTGALIAAAEGTLTVPVSRFKTP